MPKIAEIKLSSFGLEVADLKLRTSEKIAIAELRLRSKISLKSYGIAIADSKKSCACPHTTPVVKAVMSTKKFIYLLF